MGTRSPNTFLSISFFAAPMICWSVRSDCSSTISRRPHRGWRGVLPRSTAIGHSGQNLSHPMHGKCVKQLTIFQLFPTLADARLRLAGCLPLRASQCADCKLYFRCVFFTCLTKPDALTSMGGVDQPFTVALSAHCLVPDCRNPACVTICVYITQG